MVVEQPRLRARLDIIAITLPLACVGLMLLALFPLDIDPEAVGLTILAIFGLLSACACAGYGVYRMTASAKSSLPLYYQLFAFLLNALIACFFLLAIVNLPNLNQM